MNSMNSMTNLDSILKSRDISLLTKVCVVKAMVFPVVMDGCELNHKEGWALKNSGFRTVVLEKTLESPLDSNEIKPVNSKRNQPRIFIGRTDAEAEAPIFWPPDAKSWIIGKELLLVKIEGRGEKGDKDEMAGWYHQLNGHEFEQTPGDSEGQVSLACCSSWGWKELDRT